MGEIIIGGNTNMKSKRGRPAKYGDKVKLMEVFDQLHLFSKKKCIVYGKLEEVKIMSADLLWKPAGCLIRFVFAKTSKGSIVLMCSDLTINPLKALKLYCSRIRIECMLARFSYFLKNILKLQPIFI